MTKLLADRHSEIIEKQDVLNSARIQLKKEFVGIDSIIDEVIEALSSWYLFPDLQEKPVIVNLWGLTGVGKSALVQRLSELINFEEKYFHFDLGNKENKNWAIKNQLEEIYEKENSFPILVSLDEFQYARTINEFGNEMERADSNIIWQLLDTGKFQISKYHYTVGDIYDLLFKLKYLLRNGVKVSKGIVIENEDYYRKNMNDGTDPQSDSPRPLVVNPKKIKAKKETLFFVPDSFYETIFDFNKELYISSFDVRMELMKLDGKGTIEFLNKVFLEASSPKTVDCSKALIFVVGNLDEAYEMSSNLNPDMDADEFHEQSLKINIPTIKDALSIRFRSEQIARLGNMHIIYPAFSKDSFEKIIKLELKKISEWVNKLQNIHLRFDQSLLDLIYREGVYPTQGTRPLFTTIHQIVNTKLAQVMVEMIVKKLSISRVLFKATQDGIMVEYIKDDVVVHSIEIPQQFSLEKIRKNKRDDMQAITAVHEAGHAILSCILLKTVPEVIFSNSAESHNTGFVYTKFKWKYISQKEIMSRLAIYLGGYAAEKIVFGRDNVTTGTEEDLETATGFITTMLKKSGMGSVQASFNNKAVDTRFFLYDDENSLNDEALEWLKSALVLAEETLKEQEELLLKMADYLSDHRMLRMEDIKTMLADYAINFDMNSLIENGDLLFYRNHLKNKAIRFSEPEAKVYVPIENRMSLNKSENDKLFEI